MFHSWFRALEKKGLKRGCGGGLCYEVFCTKKSDSERARDLEIQGLAIKHRPIRLLCSKLLGIDPRNIPLELEAKRLCAP